MIMYVTPSPLLHVNLLLTTFGQVKNVTCKKKSKQMKLLFEKSSSAGMGARAGGRFINGSGLSAVRPL
jgi:hypothetical protein